MKNDGVRVLKAHKPSCDNRVLFNSIFDNVKWADRAGTNRGRGFSWRKYSCNHKCGAEVWIRSDKLCEFAAELMRQAEGK